MKMKKLILPAFIGTALLLTSSYVTLTHAQSPVASPSGLTLTPTPTTVRSDFAKDLEEGEKDTANDQEAKQNQKDQKDNENVRVNEQGEVENEQEGIDKQDLEESSDDLNKEEENEDSKGTIQEKGKDEEEKSDNNEKNTNSNPSQQEQITNGIDQ